MANMYVNAMTSLWNSIGTSYSAIKMNVTDAGSAVTSNLLHLQVASVDRFTVNKTGAAYSAAEITAVGGLISGGAILPATDDAAALGAPGFGWSDLHLADGGTINWVSGDVTITHSTDRLTFTGAASGYAFDASVIPTTDAIGQLGASGIGWSNLFLATGAMLNFGANNWVATHSTGRLTIGTGDLHITTAGTNAASVVTVGGTQILTSKTLTTPVLTNPSINAATLTGTLTGGTFTSTTLTNPSVTNGTFTGTLNTQAISATSGSFSSSLTVGGGITATGAIVSSGYVYTAHSFISNASNCVVASQGGGVYLRPAGDVSATSQFVVNASGSVTVPTHIQSGGTNLVMGASAGGIYFRPHGISNGSYEVTLGTGGQLTLAPSVNGVYVNKSSSGTGHGIVAFGVANQGAGLFYNDNTAYWTQCGFHQPAVRFWAAYNNGAVYATEGFFSSDENFKEDIVDCDCADAYEKVLAIKIKNYRKKIDYASNETGWLAQDVEQYLPDAVLDVPIPEMDTDTRAKMGGRDVIKATNDRSLLGTLWAAVQHQAHLIEELQAKVKAK